MNSEGFRPFYRGALFYLKNLLNLKQNEHMKLLKMVDYTCIETGVHHLRLVFANNVLRPFSNHYQEECTKQFPPHHSYPMEMMTFGYFFHIFK